MGYGTRFYGAWGEEEREGGYPYTASSETVFHRTALGWEVHIGGVRRPEFDQAPQPTPFRHH